MRKRFVPAAELAARGHGGNGMAEKKVFISHSAKDISFVRFLAEELQKYGFCCWYSEEGLTHLENWAGKITKEMKTSQYFLIVISEHSSMSGQVLNEVYQASQLNLTKIPIRLSKVPLTEELSYHLPLNAIDYFKMTDDVFFGQLLEKMNYQYKTESVSKEITFQNHTLKEAMDAHTSSVFVDVSHLGGYSWGENKSVIQNLDGGWLLENVVMESVDPDRFEFEAEDQPGYEAFFESEEFQKEVRRGRNQVRWMLTEFGNYQNKLFLSVKETEWSQTQYTWHHIFRDEERKKGAITRFFEEEYSEYPNSLSLHLVIVDTDNAVAATVIKRRKKNDYPSSIAVTLGEQITESDFRAGLKDNFVLQWMRRAFFEEFGFDEREYHRYVSEGTARVMSLDMEGDIYNLALVCCVKINCTCQQLGEYYAMHRSADEEFDRIFPIPAEDIPGILKHSEELALQYHPSSFLRLLFAYVYITGEFPEVQD